MGWVRPEVPASKTGKKVAVIGSGPPAWPPPSSSPAPATTCISTRSTGAAGGLLRYGIPDFKMEKHHVDRRVEQMEADGRDLPLQRPYRRDAFHEGIVDGHDAVVMSGGAEKPRDLPIRAATWRNPFRHGLPAAAEPPRVHEGVPGGDILAPPSMSW